jgi:hypothetical protein
MRGHVAFVLLAATVLVLATAPTSAALSHRVKYDALGIAIDGSTVYSLELSWSGQCTLLYTIVLKDIAGTVVSDQTFRGYQEHTHPAENPNQPAEIHYRVDGFSTTSGVQFNVLGVMLDTVNSAPHLHIAGVFQGTYQGMQIAYVVVPGPYTNC